MQLDMLEVYTDFQKEEEVVVVQVDVSELEDSLTLILTTTSYQYIGILSFVICRTSLSENVQKIEDCRKKTYMTLTVYLVKTNVISSSLIISLSCCHGALYAIYCRQWMHKIQTEYFSKTIIFLLYELFFT